MHNLHVNEEHNDAVNRLCSAKKSHKKAVTHAKHSLSHPVSLRLFSARRPRAHQCLRKNDGIESLIFKFFFL